MHKLKGGLATVFLFVVLAASAWLSLKPAGSNASDTDSWLGSTALTLTKISDIAPDQLPQTMLNGGNIQCEVTYDNKCSIDTLYGPTYPSATNINGNWVPIRDYANNGNTFIPIPGSDMGLTISNSPSTGSYIYYDRNVSTELSPQYTLRPGATGINAIDDFLLDHFKLSRPPDGKLADLSDTRLAADIGSINFSADSQWMIVTDPGIATLRVNLSDGSVLPFGLGFSYTYGFQPQPQTAVTADGRYAVVASGSFSYFSIYDLSTCGNAPKRIYGPVSCAHRDLFQLMRSQIPGFTGASQLKFLSNDSLMFYASYKDGNATKYAQYELSTKSAEPTQLQYLALGDSYISGEGASRLPDRHRHGH